VDSGFWLGAVDGWVMTAAVDGWGKTYVGGLFQNHLNPLIIPPVPACARNSIARMHGDGSCDTTFNPGAGANNWVFALAPQPDRSLYIGGAFTQVDNTPRGGIAKLNPDGSLNVLFNPLGVDTGGSVGAIVVQPDQKLVLGGVFQKMNVFDRKNLARMTPDGAVDPGFVADTNADVLALALQSDGKILAGGKFTQLNGLSRTYLARLLADGSPETTFNSNINGEVWTIHVQSDGKILIGGLFTTIDGVPRSGIARLLPGGALDPSFNPGTGTDGPVAHIARQRDGRILIGGLFSTYNNIARSGIARLNPDGAIHPDFDPGSGAGGTVPFLTFPAVRTIVPQENGRILIGGPFDQYNGSPRYFLARLNGHSALAFFGQLPTTAELGKPYYHILQATGLPSPRFEVTSGTLPPGLSLSRYTGILSGIPLQTGPFSLTITAYNQFPPVASQAFTLTVDQAHIYLPLLLRH
jgi:uncharacterized delta-60 repeat protein